MGVAPHAGAWIETELIDKPLRISIVAPHAGAWIETQALRTAQEHVKSPLMQGRGSKLMKCCLVGLLLMSPLMQGRGSKRYISNPRLRHVQSPLMQGRGSKPITTDIGSRGEKSPLMQGRGSKLRQMDKDAKDYCRPSCRGVDRNNQPRCTQYPVRVAPHAGAWIETFTNIQKSSQI